MQNAYKVTPSNSRYTRQTEKTENKWGQHKPGTEKALYMYSVTGKDTCYHRLIIHSTQLNEKENPNADRVT